MVQSGVLDEGCGFPEVLHCCLTAVLAALLHGAMLSCVLAALKCVGVGGTAERVLGAVVPACRHGQISVAGASKFCFVSVLLYVHGDRPDY